MKFTIDKDRPRRVALDVSYLDGVNVNVEGRRVAGFKQGALHIDEASLNALGISPLHH